MARKSRPPPLAALARFFPHMGRLARAEKWKRHGNRPRIWAHRGASALVTENTLAAFDRARDDGADGIELDVQLDRDGTVCVFHDDTLDRLVGRPGRLQDLSTLERRALRVSGHPIPTLEEVLGELGEMDCNVEIKSQRLARETELVKATAEVIRQSGRADQILVSSFDPFALVQLHTVLPDIALAYLFHEKQVLPLRRGWVGNAMGASLFHPEHTLCTEESVGAWHRAGLPVNAWTVDDADELRRLDKLEIDGVFCNDPAHALSVFA
ncbi:MAG: glycerophosphodiester phosphodiesterase family protein [Kofleriaceae bacterium]